METFGWHVHEHEAMKTKVWLLISSLKVHNDVEAMKQWIYLEYVHTYM